MIEAKMLCGETPRPTLDGVQAEEISVEGVEGTTISNEVASAGCSAACCSGTGGGCETATDLLEGDVTTMGAGISGGGGTAGRTEGAAY